MNKLLPLTDMIAGEGASTEPAVDVFDFALKVNYPSISPVPLGNNLRELNNEVDSIRSPSSHPHSDRA